MKSNAARVINDPASSEQGKILAGITINALQQQVHNLLMRRNDLFASTLDTKHKINQDCGYPESLGKEEYIALYEREGIAARVVHLLPDESWKDDPEVIESQDTSVETAFEREWVALERRFRIYNILHRVDRLSGIGHYGLLLLGINDGKELNLPIEGVEDALLAELNGKAPPPTTIARNAAPRQLLYLRAFSEKHVTIDEYETDNTHPRYGLPRLYTINFNEVNTHNSTISPAPQMESKKVHWTRVVHVADDCEESEVFGTPRMQNVYNRLFDLRKICGGSGEMFWRGGFPGINFKVDPLSKGTRGMTDEERDALKAEVTDYISGLQRYIATEGMTAESISPQVADPTAHFEMNLKAIAVSKGCPYRIFTGTEEGKLAGGQDAKAWNGRVNRRRSKHCSAYIIRPVVDRLIILGIVSRPKEYFVTWSDLNTTDEAQKAQNAQHLATAISIYVSSGGDAVVPPEQFLSHILGLSNDVVETIMEATKEWVRNLEDKIEHDAEVEQQEMDMQKKQAEVQAQVAKAKATVKPNGRPAAKPAGASRR